MWVPASILSPIRRHIDRIDCIADSSGYVAGQSQGLPLHIDRVDSAADSSGYVAGQSQGLPLHIDRTDAVAFLGAGNHEGCSDALTTPIAYMDGNDSGEPPNDLHPLHPHLLHSLLPALRYAFLPNPLQQHARRLVARVLWHQLALERALENGLAQPLGALEIRRLRRLDLGDHREPPFDLGDDPLLLGEGWKHHRCHLELIKAEMRSSCPIHILFVLMLTVFRRDEIKFNIP